MQPTIIFDHVSKKFSQTYVSDSLRDTLLTPFKKLFGMSGNKSDKENKEFWALRDVNFQVEPGEALGIIGPNGSGKTTTLKLLSRILRPDGGRIVVHGRIGALIELAAGINPEFNGRENVYLNATILGMRRQEIERKYDEIVEFAELQEFMETPVKWYSSGMLARLAFSVAVHIDPDVLLVDEILSVGDIGFQRKCFDMMRAFKSQGTTIVFVSHNLHAVTSLCDRVILLSKGAVDREGLAENVIRHYLNTITQTTHDSNEGNFITLKKGGLFDSQGTIKTIFKSGEQAKVNIEILFKKEYLDIFISSVIRSSSELIIFSTNSMRLGGSSLSVKKGESALFSFGLTVNLAPGIYDLRTGVFDRTTNKWVIINYTLTSFIVEEDSRFDGIAFINPQLLNLKVQS
ncbi:MAG: ABC transporter ATP-binding protein [Deltaproteobacteria bacterium]|nr:ABC transporter ATP-binding protein [Deltaproteobacteria bacterium]